ncbi:MAG: hypothetical protein JXR70_11640 [Spirochaetales bacterium]|nr:hypothetical protein [Spirochaetales bacterium]
MGLSGITNISDVLAACGIGTINFSFARPDLTCQNSIPCCDMPEGQCPLYKDDMFSISLGSGAVDLTIGA